MTKKNKQSPELRPRRRASQTYFFKYQLARNPLKAEEEDLKLALQASLQQCAGSTSSSTSHQQDSGSEAGSSRSSGSVARSQSSKTSKSSSRGGGNRHETKINGTTNHTTATNSNTINNNSTNHINYNNIKPETEDFLSFICFRFTANQNHLPPAAQLNGQSTPQPTPQNYQQSQLSQPEQHQLPIQQQKPSGQCKITDYFSPSNRRRPTRQSPRLANSSRRISENDSFNNNTVNTAHLNNRHHIRSINYEEDMKRASIALEDMAQEINSGRSERNDGVLKPSPNSSPFKNNKHIVKGLMTREFAGAFADEEIIFESISKHTL